jgi:hypothetical protein
MDEKVKELATKLIRGGRIGGEPKVRLSCRG